jgi:anaphase-promoting complex subunit 2
MTNALHLCHFSSYRLTDEESGGDLYKELRRQDATLLEQVREPDEEGVSPDPNWQPGATPRQKAFALAINSIVGIDNMRSCEPVSNVTQKPVDILAMLVGIYGSQDLFVNEYRSMLADKLLSNLEFDTEKEVHTLELLKLRFGEQSLRQCEIMIKDVDDSKRVVSNVRSRQGTPYSDKEKENYVVDAVIVSDIFWPTLLKEDLKVHHRMQGHLEHFSKEFGKIKNPMQLIWFRQLGTVQIQIQFGDEDPREFQCSPLQATVIAHFEDKDTWTACDLSNETGVPVDTLKRRMAYWQNQGVLQASSVKGGETEYTLPPSLSLDNGLTSRGEGAMEYEEEDQTMASLQEVEEAEKMKVFESFISGMLMNIKQLPIQQIHNNLKMFTMGSDLKYDKTPQQLSILLKYLCKEDKLELGEDGMYRVPKQSA